MVANNPLPKHIGRKRSFMSAGATPPGTNGSSATKPHAETFGVSGHSGLA